MQRPFTPFWINLYLWWKMPAARFMGVRLSKITEESGEVELPFTRRSQNPFRSIYFAAQCSAGELSTGVLALGHLRNKPSVSMLVLKVEAEFYKKADQTLRFVCHDGKEIAGAIDAAIAEEPAQIFRAESAGYLPDGSVASRIWITWSFKRKNR